MAIASISYKGACLPFEICIAITNYKALNVTVEETKNSRISTLFVLQDPDYYIIEKLCPRRTFHLLVVCSYLQPFTTYKSLNLTVDEKTA